MYVFFPRWKSLWKKTPNQPSVHIRKFMIMIKAWLAIVTDGRTDKGIKISITSILKTICIGGSSDRPSHVLTHFCQFTVCPKLLLTKKHHHRNNKNLPWFKSRVYHMCTNQPVPLSACVCSLCSRLSDSATSQRLIDSSWLLQLPWRRRRRRRTMMVWGRNLQVGVLI